MRLFAFIIVMGVLFAGCNALAQETTAGFSSTTNPTPVLAKESNEKTWSFSASAYTYFVPDDRDYVQPTLTADHGWLHLEARYNYEALDTSSLWIGYSYNVGDKMELELTPMLGGVFGTTDGVAPGYKGTLGWWKIELYSEGEYLFNTGDSSENFFYNWSELTVSPADWIRFGLVTQRTHLYQTDREIQRGFLVGFSFKRLDFTTYVFNPDDKPLVVLGMGVNF
jgi:hypothetical protein